MAQVIELPAMFFPLKYSNCWVQKSGDQLTSSYMVNISLFTGFLYIPNSWNSSCFGAFWKNQQDGDPNCHQFAYRIELY